MNRLYFILLLLVFTWHPEVNAQQILSYDALIEKGLENNLPIKKAQLETQYHQKNVKTQLSIQPTDFSVEFGDVNTNVFDEKIGVEQRFLFPTFYKKQKQLNEQMIRLAQSQEKVSEKMLEQQIGNLYAEYQYIQHKIAIANENVAMYNDFLAKAKLRFDKGASNRSEVATATLRHQNSVNEQSVLFAQSEQIKIELKNILQIPDDFDIAKEDINYQIPIKNTTQLHVVLANQQEVLKAAQMQVDVEKTKRLPELTVGYYNQSFREINTNRFQSVMIGVAVPIFQSSTNAGIKAAETRIKIEENQLLQQTNRLAQQTEQLQIEVRTLDTILETYNKIQLPEATILQKNTQAQLFAGEINFLDWVLLNDQIIALKNQFAEQLFTRNIKAVSLNYLVH